ncbi:MAG: N-acetylmuramoyl-L-alanine amidase family protein [Tissierellaceae bacterium]
MKRWKRIFVFTLFLLILGTNTYAAKDGFIYVGVNGSSVKVRQVDVLLDGQVLESEIPSFIHIDRTLVPVRFVAENYGAKVDWEQKTKTATITYGDKEIKLTIDSPLASLNGESRILDKNSIPKLVTFGGEDASTMVPLAFISEIFGYEIGYDTEKEIPFINSRHEDSDDDEDTEEVEDGDEELENTITQIYLDKGSTDGQKLIIKSKERLQYDTKVIRDSDELVIDVKNAKLDLPKTGDSPVSIPVTDKNIKWIEYSQHSTDPYVTRIVIKMDGELDYDIYEAQDKKTNIVSFVNKIGEIDVENIDGRRAIIIEGAGNAKYNIMKLDNPKRIVIDLMDSSLEEGTEFSYDHELEFIKGIRGSQFSGDNNYKSIDRIVRVVLDVKGEADSSNINIYTEDDKMIITPEKSIWEYISYDVDGKQRTLNIENMDRTSYSVYNYPEQKMLEIVIPSDSTELESGVGKLNDGLVDEINVLRNRDEVVVQLKYKKSIEYEVLSRERDRNIELSISRNSNIKPSDRLIVIDAGHGGSDPGASSITGKREKDLALSVSNKLNNSLKAKGYNTLMTRNTDVFVDLYERARIANINNADIFVSIHGNSFTNNKTVKGIEVYYWPKDKSKIKEEEQYPLAKSIFDELIRATSASSRGVKTNAYVVIKETRMPAVLIETGFLTNPEEEKLLYSDEYQNKMVEGIIKGIENYFEIY